jgi:alkaline phosphatase D
MKKDMSRRRLIKDLALASLLWPASNRAWAQAKLNKNPFALGVASGSATHDSVVLWTRLFDPGFFSSNIPDETISVKWEISRDEAFTQLVQEGVSPAVPGLAHSVHAEVSRLPANQWFFYRFMVGTHVSPIGRTRTFAAPGQTSQALKVAVASCQHYELGYFNTYPHVVAEQPDLMVFLGDYIYEYPPAKAGVRSVDGSWCLSLSDYRKRYALYKQDKDLQQVHACCPWLVTWDDHEVQNDYAGLQEGSGGNGFTDFRKRRAAAYQAYFEHMPLKSSVLAQGLKGLEDGAEVKIYDHYRFGNLLAISMLDCRQYRSPQACTPGGKTGSGVVDKNSCTALSQDDRSLLGMTQEQWLDKQLQQSPQHTWNVIAQSTLFGARVFRSSSGPKVWNDGWDGYPAARKRLVSQLITHQVPNPVILGGDVHSNWVGYIKEDYDKPDSKTVGVEFCGTSISSYDANIPASTPRNNPHFVFADGNRKGYLIASISHSEIRMHLRVVKDHRTQVSDIETLASFKVAAGTSRIEPMGA